MSPQSAKINFHSPFNPGRRRFIKFLGSGTFALFLYGCGVAPQAALPEATPEPTTEPAKISPIETGLAQHPLLLIDAPMLQELLQQQDPYAAAYASAVEELIQTHPDWQTKTMADFEVAIMVLSGEGKQANEGQLYVTIEGQTWILGRYREGVGIEPIVEPVVAAQASRGPRLKYGNTILMEAATVNNVKGVKAFRIDGSTVFSGESSLTNTKIGQSQHAEAAISPVILPADMEISVTQYADKQLLGINNQGSVVATYDFDRWVWSPPVPADWMAGQVEGLVGMWKNQVAYMVKEMADGRRIKVFEYVEGNWQPSYGSFVREDGTFDLEAAQQTTFMRMGPVEKVNGQPAKNVNSDDYQRFVAEMKAIYQNLRGLAPSGLDGIDGTGTASALVVGEQISIRIKEEGGQWQLVGFARNPIGSESVIAVATDDGLAVMLNVGDLRYHLLDNDHVSIEDGVVIVANRTLERGDMFSFVVNEVLNSGFRGEVNPEAVAEVQAYVRGMGINWRELAAMMYGDTDKKRLTLAYMADHYPVPIEDFGRLTRST